MHFEDKIQELDREDDIHFRNCERCKEFKECQEIPLMGYSEWLCRACAAAAYRNEEAI